MGGCIKEGLQVGLIWKDEGEVAVELLYQGALGAEVCVEAEAGERQVAKALRSHSLDKAFHPRLTEEVNRLAGVADQEDGLRIAVPVGGKPLDEIVLGGGCVLHFVNQEVLQACAERGGDGRVSGRGRELQEVGHGSGASADGAHRA